MKAFVVCARRYNGHELWTALGVLQQSGVEFDLASTSTRIEDEITSQANKIHLTLDDVSARDVSTFDGLMFISGNMKDTEAYWHLPQTKAYVLAAEEAGKPIAAICCSVPTIRWAARGKRVSFFPLVRSRTLLAEAGAILSTVSITVDQNLATAEHQMSTQVWAEQFVHLVKGEGSTLHLRDSGFVPTGKTPKRLKPQMQRLHDNLKLKEVNNGHDSIPSG